MHSAISRLPKSQHLDIVITIIKLLPHHTTLGVQNTHPDCDISPKTHIQGRHTQLHYLNLLTQSVGDNFSASLYASNEALCFPKR